MAELSTADRLFLAVGDALSNLGASAGDAAERAATEATARACVQAIAEQLRQVRHKDDAARVAQLRRILPLALLPMVQQVVATQKADPMAARFEQRVARLRQALSDDAALKALDQLLGQVENVGRVGGAGTLTSDEKRVKGKRPSLADDVMQSLTGAKPPATRTKQQRVSLADQVMRELGGTS